MTVANTFLAGKCAISMNISQMRLVMDQENYPHDFTTALVPGPVPNDYYTDEYKYHSNTSGAGDLICIAAQTEYPDAAFEFCMWYLTGGMAPLAKGGRIPLWTGFDQDLIVEMIKENAGDSIDEQSLRNYLSIDNTKSVASPSLWANSEIATVYKEEVEALCYNQQSVDDTISNICTRANQLIADAIAAAK
jgi:multiple sugar transport system substrate-binding protein